jgi:hypothetical protein
VKGMAVLRVGWMNPLVAFRHEIWRGMTYAGDPSADACTAKPSPRHDRLKHVIWKGVYFFFIPDTSRFLKKPLYSDYIMGPAGFEPATSAV